MTSPIIIVGGGGHAAVLADALIASGETILGFTDSNPSLHGRTICGHQVLGDDQALDRYSNTSVLLVNGIGGIGTNGTRLRQALQRKLTEQGWRFASVRHPQAIVSRFATVRDGAQILAAGVVQAGADVGEGCIVNTAAVVEHDVQLGAWSHVAPRAVVCGDVQVGARSHIGAGAIIRQGLRLGEDVMVGVGAVVVRDFVTAGLLLVGVPARPMELNS